MTRDEELKNIKERQFKYITFYKNCIPVLEKINSGIMTFDEKVYNRKFIDFLINAGSKNIYIDARPGEIMLIPGNDRNFKTQILLSNFTYCLPGKRQPRINATRFKKFIASEITEMKNEIKKIEQRL